ncbi:MAG: RNA 2',3'-cyclic phosphodiesterase [Clostridia bacterium]|nr:RNA 2',3'-cyclic phosphodiesterase [Clostridia bacterium]
MRLFIALIPDEATVDAVCQTQSMLKAAGVRGSYTSRSNIHLTLAFIGEYDHPEKILRILRSCGEPSFAIELAGTGRFGDVWWEGVKANREMYAYAAKIRAELEKAGVPYDKKPFSPHITLLRRPDRDTIPAITPPKAVTVSPHAALMRSDRGERGMIYTEIK